MSDASRIPWTQRTWNPWKGCDKVSPGCAHCYMYRQAAQYGWDPTRVQRTTDATFYRPLRSKEWRTPALVFTCSWSDFFHEDADQWRDEAWRVIRETPHLTYQVLTKRPERIADHLPADWGEGYPNVWLGTSVENQHWADIRIPILASIPAAVRFLSCEPLLKPLDLSMGLRWWRCMICERTFADVGEGCPHNSEFGSVVSADRIAPPISWVIVGGESGPDGVRRPMSLDWARDIQRQCAEAGVPFFFKQVSHRLPDQGRAALGRLYEEFPEARP